MSVPYWRLSGFYLFYFAALGGFVPYWGLYLKYAGFNTAQIGELSAYLVGIKIIAPNLLGAIADRSGKSLPIIRLASLLAVLFFTGFLYSHRYWEFVAVTVAFSFFWSAALPQFEAATLLHLKDEPHRYSRIRLWGSMGFIAAVLGVGGWLDIYPITSLPAVIIALLAGIALVALSVPEARALSHNSAPPLGMGKILRKPEVIAFFVVCILLQAAHASYYAFYSILLKQHQYSSSLTGGLWALGVVAEIVLFIFMRPLLARVSLRALLLTSIGLSVVRWLLIAYCAASIGLLTVAQWLHAMTFGGVHVASIHLVQQYFGDRHQGKGQALYNGFSAGLGGMLGSFASGYYWDRLGADFVYAAAALCCAVALLIAYRWVGKGTAVIAHTL
jgi:PPP family 3-phenylpropionic acid transporter